MITHFNIDDCFSFTETTTGKKKISFEWSDESKLFVLNILNLAKTFINDKPVIVKKSVTGVDYIGDIHYVNSLVFSVLKGVAIHYTGNLTYEEISNFIIKYHKKFHITKKDLYNLCESVELNEEQYWRILYKHNSSLYKDQLHLKAISTLKDKGFKHTMGFIQCPVDIPRFPSSEKANKDIYYKHLGNNRYVIFYVAAYYPKSHNYTIDVFECSYKSENRIGKEPASSKVIPLKYGFDIIADIDILNKYLN